MLVDVIAFKHKINVCKHVCNPSYYVLLIKIHTRDLFGRENVLAIHAPTNRGETVQTAQCDTGGHNRKQGDIVSNRTVVWDRGSCF